MNRTSRRSRWRCVDMFSQLSAFCCCCSSKDPFPPLSMKHSPGRAASSAEVAARCRGIIHAVRVEAELLAAAALYAVESRTANTKGQT